MSDYEEHKIVKIHDKCHMRFYALPFAKKYVVQIIWNLGISDKRLSKDKLEERTILLESPNREEAFAKFENEVQRLKAAQVTL